MSIIYTPLLQFHSPPHPAGFTTASRYQPLGSGILFGGYEFTGGGRGKVMLCSPPAELELYLTDRYFSPEKESSQNTPRNCSEDYCYFCLL